MSKEEALSNRESLSGNLNSRTWPASGGLTRSVSGSDVWFLLIGSAGGSRFANHSPLSPESLLAERNLEQATALNANQKAKQLFFKLLKLGTYRQIESTEFDSVVKQKRMDYVTGEL